MTQKLASLFTLIALAFFIGMGCFFFIESLPIWKKEGVSFLIGTKWSYRHELFGLLPMIYGSAVVSFLALLLAAPVGVAAAIFISEYSPGRVRPVLKTLVELLAGVPSVVYGLLGVLVLRQFVYRLFPVTSGDTLLTGALLLAVMILPTVVSLCDDALQAVPRRYREAARGMGFTQAETIYRVLLPCAKAGIVSSLLLSLGRAVGETIALFLVVGRADNRFPESLWAFSPWLQAGQTLTSKLGGSEVHLSYGNTLHWSALCGAGLVLFAGVLLIYLLGEGLHLRRERARSL